MNSMKSLECINCKSDRGQIAAGNNVTQKDIHRIAVIGGGAGGLSFCVQFYGKIKSVPLNSLVEILVFEKGKEIGTGLPYSCEDDVFITNTPKCNHNVSVAYEGHFTQWLEDNGYDYGWTDFPPGHVFGKYLKAQAELLLKKATKHPNIRLRYLTETEVLEIRHADSSVFETVGNQYVVLSRDIKGNSYVEWRANEIVLCSGHFPSDPYRELRGNPGYVHNPSGEYERICSIPKNEDVVVIGSRLSAVDVVLQLSSQRHRGRIIMASRSGLLPIVFNPAVNADKRCVVYPWHVGPSYEEPDTCQHLNQTSYKFESDFGDLDTVPLDKIVQAVLQDLGESIACPDITFDWIMERAQKMSPLEWLEYHIKLSESNNTEPWEIFLHALFNKIPLLWSRMSVEDQSKFFKKYHSLFLTYMAEFPLENAYKVRELLASGRLSVIGGVENIEYEAKTAEFIDKTNRCDLNNNSEIRVRYVVNATGPGSTLSEIPLYRNMMKHGLVVPHTSGELYVDIHTLQLQNPYFLPNSGIYALGELTKGHFLMTLCFSQVVQMADRVAHCICEKLFNEHFCE